MPSLKTTRDNFSKAAIQALRDRAGNLCSQPSCQSPTIGADQSTTDGVTLIGVAAHIKAASPGGPRYDPHQSQAERGSVKNGIWLCSNCATLVDKSGGANFSVTTLNQWKFDAEKNSSDQLLFRNSRIRPDWLHRIHYAQYINVPRLSTILNIADSMKNLGLDSTKGFRGLGMQIAPVSGHLEASIATSSIKAIPIHDLMPPSDEIIGETISFDQRCYTKNGVDAGTTVAPSLLANFDPNKSPHFYFKISKIKIIFPYDPAWVTTSTAYCDFRSGSASFAGLGVVKRIDIKENQVFVSPVIVALPRNEFMQSWYGSR
ncbi:hypothetical protein [Methylobacterium trifolii]|uniref:HNH endonuclease n=1 Tax=Methylobacterium trifolii TaxID=1003092 RepID=A0ABQ4U1A8_9HYPH|nr:hypothetical protein [Methylobacterium trifolii]GJE60561.1 hypothetical protein MPOCJGCO_2674 [Methylobacterium trifolii]